MTAIAAQLTFDSRDRLSDVLHEFHRMARFPLHIIAAFAELEREIIGERVVAGVKDQR